MSTAGLQDLPLEIFSGLVTDLAASDLPPGASPACSDVAFILGGVKTRPGLQPSIVSNVPAAFINYLKTFTDSNLNNRLLYLDSLGNTFQEFPQGTLTNLTTGASGLRPAPANSFGKSTSLFSREYIAISDGKFGIDIPRQFDTALYDRVSQVGPAVAPIAADNANAGGTPIVASPNGATQPAAVNIAAASTSGGFAALLSAGGSFGVKPGDKFTVAGVSVAGYNGFWTCAAISPDGTNMSYAIGGSLANGAGGTLSSAISTITTTVPNNVVLGTNVTLSAIGVGGYNGTWVVRSIISTTVFTVVVGAGGLAASGGGTVQTAGTISAGKHQVVVIFVTRQGYLTMPSPAGSWTAAGNLAVQVSQIPVGPPNVVARILAFTAAAGAVFYYTTGSNGTPNFVIPDNVTTTFYTSFTDAGLVNGTNASNLFNQVELGESCGVIGYASRLFWWGERAKVQNFLNLSFDGGFNASPTVPDGWLFDPVNGAGGSADLANAIWGWAYRITGDGVAALKGMITQSATLDQFEQNIIQAATPYSVRVRLLKGGAIVQGNAVVELFSASQGSLGRVTVPVANISAAAYTEFIGAILPSTAVIPTDLVLRIYLSGTPTNGGWVDFENIELFPTLTPFFNSQLRASYVEDPEGYDGITGLLSVAPNNGQSVRSAFVLREKLYVVKDKSLHTTEDDGQNEPDLWTVNEVSNVVGTPSANGVDIGEEWAVIAGRNGLYIFWGPEPVKISQEIQPLWNTINWNAGSTIWVRVDNLNKRLLVGVPTNGAAAPNQVLYFDYRGLDTAQEIADHWTVKYSGYTGKILAIGNSPKWAPWTMSINSCALIERNDGTAHMFMGNGPGGGAGPGNSKIYDLLDSQKSDDGVGIPWSYSTYFFPGHQDEQVLQLGAHRKLFGYLTGLVRGSGAMSTTMQPIGNITPTVLPNIQLVDPTVTAAITNLARFQGVLTVTCAGGHGLTANDSNVVIAGTDDPNSNGTEPILQILNAQQFTIFQLGLPDLPAQGAGGTAARLLRDFEFTTNVEGERCQYTFANSGNVAGTWFQMEKIIVSLERSAAAPVRGHA